MYTAKKWRRSLGLIYIKMEDNKRNITAFIKDFLSSFDPKLLEIYSKRKFDIKKRKPGIAFFVEGKELTMIILDNQIFIHAVDEDSVINIIQGLIQVTK